MPNFRVVKRRDGKSPFWHVAYYEGGKEVLVSSGETEYARGVKYRDGFAKAYYTDKEKGTTVAKVLMMYQASHSVVNDETRDLNVQHFLDYFGTDVLVREINKVSIGGYIKKRQKAGDANSYINRRLSTLKAALKHCAGKEGYTVPDLPTLSVATTEKEWMRKSQAAKLLRATSLYGRYAYVGMFIRIGLYTAARHRAILNLTWDRVDLETGFIDFREPGVEETKKKRPHTSMSDRLWRLMARYKRMVFAKAAAKGRKMPKYVIEHRGDKIGSIKKAFAEAVKRAGLEGEGFTPHTLKHTYITWALRGSKKVKGLTVFAVAGLTNTSPTTIQKHYGHHAQDALMRAAANQAGMGG